MMNPLNIRCKKCGKSFDRGEQMSLYNNQYYHNSCFVCNFCDQSLAGLGFYTKPDGSFQCKRCHTYHAPKCFLCNEAIPDGVKYNIYQGKYFHKTCFKCMKCHGPIPEGRSFLEHPDGFICLDCGKVTNQGHKGKVFGRDPTSPSNASASTEAHPSGREHICAKCVRPIPPNTVYGIYEAKQFHQECFTCNRCSKNLVNTVCRRLGSAIVCKDCT
ncbi:unnamed protein product [Brachionus calyciflorus]|uniref:LIM zinc-binding domain-containing protein n=1 Tax=Brachionus calyciflorus TaxID=104777 RepID=A0A813NJ01_9BILA|nr:unnamed protein product [Brachionus calyciflorus]